VTHHLEEVFRVADAVTVLRDGVVVGRSPIGQIERPELVEMLAGAPVEHPAPEAATGPSPGQATLVVDDLWAGALRGVSFSVAAGEIVGVAGLTGSGRESVLAAVFGAEPRDSGTVLLEGRPLAPRRPDRAVAAGVGLLPADRKGSSGIMSLCARENMTLADLRPFSTLWFSRRQESAEAARWFADLHVRPAAALEMDLGRFSGGNQQKILFAKWLRRRPKVLLLEEPTQGVDIGAKAELHRQIRTAVGSGMAVVVSSTDTEELVSLCSRVLVIRGGRISAELTGPQITVASITKSVMSDADRPQSAGGTNE
jgi:ribose transport system ATP-binding protein